MRKDALAQRPRQPYESKVKTSFPHPLVEAHTRAMYISYGRDRCGSATAGTPQRMLVQPVAIRRNVGFDVFNVRLLIGLDKLLRAKRRYQGDLSASINDALLAVNLNTVKLVALQGKKKQTARETQVVLLRRLIRSLHRTAKTRNCSINQLVNSGLAAHYSKDGHGRLGGSSRPTRRPTKATYDKMSSAERQQLFEVLATLTGLKDGPTGKFSDGTRFEYDRKLGKTVEVTLAGKRFPVMLVAGKFQRESETAVTRKTAR